MSQRSSESGSDERGRDDRRRRSVERGRGSVTAAEEMVASVARRQQPVPETAAVAEKVAARGVQSAAGGEEAAATGTMARRVLVAGAAVEEILDMARRVLVAEAVTVAVEVIAGAATEGSRAQGCSQCLGLSIEGPNNSFETPKIGSEQQAERGNVAENSINNFCLQ